MPKLARQVVAQGLPVVRICRMLLLSWPGLLIHGGLFQLPICVLTRGVLTGQELLVSSLAVACCTCNKCISMDLDLQLALVAGR